MTVRERLVWALIVAVCLNVGVPAFAQAPPGGAGAGAGAGAGGGGAGAGAAAGTPGQVLGQVNRVLFRGTEEELAQIERVLAQYDRIPRQVLLEMFLLDVNVKRGENSGITFNTFFGATRPFQSLPLGNYSATQSLTNYDQSLRFGSLSTEKFQVFMQFLKNMTDSRILNRPAALVMDGGTAVVNLGGQLRYLARVETTVVPNSGTVRSPITETLDTGQNMSVTPRIMPNDMILMNMAFDDTTFNTFETFGTGESQVRLPQTSRRAMSMPMFLKNGSAVIVGGLRNQRKQRTSSKIPLLGDLPFIGRNLGRNEKSNETNELVVIVKASVYAQEDF